MHLRLSDWLTGASYSTDMQKQSEKLVKAFLIAVTSGGASWYRLRFRFPRHYFPQHIFNLYASMSLRLSPLLKGPASDGLSSGDLEYRLNYVEER